LAGVQKFFHGRNQTLALPTIHEELLPLPCYCRMYQTGANVSIVLKNNDVSVELVGCM
jgi:hypothetical protein